MVGTNIFAQDSSILEKENELKKIEKTIRDTELKKNETKKTEKKILQELDSINLRLKVKERELSVIERNLLENKKKSMILTQELLSAQSRLAQYKDYLSKRLVRQYFSGKFSFWRTLFTQQSYRDILLRSRYNRIIAYTDAKYILLTNQASRKIQKQQFDLAELDRSQRIQQQELTRAKKIYLAEQANKTLFLTKVRNDRATYERTIAELKEAAVKLEAMIRELRSRQIAAREVTYSGEPFSAMQRRLIWPVSEGKIIAGFGRQKVAGGESEIVLTGITIRAPIGTPVDAVHSGRVIFADWLAGYGNMVIIDHGKGYWTTYAHLQDIFVSKGQDVIRKQQIGSVGDTGSLIGAQLYFEIRKDGKPIDPETWLVGR
ncbi:MAG: peptidoglycan DD-metalloendopeptidase family protein [bacterium]|nr:peptidoglycan DD-metalloendopeptidase family protein [bacterium]